jgi:acyl-coenzyme A synthetase/AMP-(fatty) acid ligase
MYELCSNPQHPLSWLQIHARQRGSAIFLEDNRRSLSFSDLVQEVGQGIANLQKHGITAGAMVACVFPRDVREVIGLLALLACGATVAPLNRLWRPTQMMRAVSGMGGDCFILCENRLMHAINLETGATPLQIKHLTPEQIFADGPAVSWQQEAAQEGRLILYTSGSSGTSKGVIHTISNLCAWTDSSIEYLGITQKERIYGYLSLSFGYGLNQFLCALRSGATYRLANSILCLDVLREAAQWRASALAGIPQFWHEVRELLQQKQLHHTDLSLRYLTNAGGHLARDTQLRLKDHLPDCDIISMYGMTETLRSTWVPPAMFESKAGSIGIPVPGASLYLLSDDGVACSAGDTGELVHVGPTLAVGYLHVPKQDCQRFRPLPHTVSGGHLLRACYTADMAQQDDDQFYWYKGRRDRQVKIRGFRFAPHEIEEEVRKLPGVGEACLVYLHTSGQTEGILHLVLYSANTISIPDCEACRLHLRQNFASYMLPHGIHLSSKPVPLTANGKLDYNAITTWLQSELISEAVVV